MRPSSTLLIATAAVAACAFGCVVDTAGAPCATDDDCPSGQSCGSDGLCALGAAGEKDSGPATGGDAGVTKDTGHRDAAEVDVPGSDDGGGDAGDDAGSADVTIIDAGIDAGSDAGKDAGLDAGIDGGADAGDGGACKNECTPKGARECVTQNAWRECVDLDNDGCLEWSPQTSCLYGCESGDCKTCVPNCGALAKECGDNGCGGSCGDCMAPAPDYCIDSLHYRVYDRPGTCLASFKCLHSYDDRPCPGGCTGNVCINNTLATWSLTFQKTYGLAGEETFAGAVQLASANVIVAGPRNDPQGSAVEGWITEVKADGSYQANCPAGFGKSASGAVGPSGFRRATNIIVASGASTTVAWPISSAIDPWRAAFSDQCTP